MDAGWYSLWMGGLCIFSLGVIGWSLGYLWSLPSVITSLNQCVNSDCSPQFHTVDLRGGQLSNLAPATFDQHAITHQQLVDSVKHVTDEHSQPTWATHSDLEKLQPYLNQTYSRRVHVWSSNAQDLSQWKGTGLTFYNPNPFNAKGILIKSVWNPNDVIAYIVPYTVPGHWYRATCWLSGRTSNTYSIQFGASESLLVTNLADPVEEYGEPKLFYTPWTKASEDTVELTFTIVHWSTSNSLSLLISHIEVDTVAPLSLS